MPTRFVRFAELKAAYGVPYSRSHVSRLVKEGKFPAPVPLGDGGFVAWVQAEIEEWQQARMAERDEPSPTR